MNKLRDHYTIFENTRIGKILISYYVVLVLFVILGFFAGYYLRKAVERIEQDQVTSRVPLSPFIFPKV